VRVLAEVARVWGFRLHVLVFLQILLMELAVIASGSLLFGVYGFYDSIVDAGSPGAVVVTSISLAPFTSVVNVGQLRERLRSVPGVEIEERVYALVRLRNSTVILVGLGEEALKSVSSSASSARQGCLLIGEDLARELGVREGVEVLVYSPYTSLPYVLRVCGLASGWPYSWMLVSDLTTARFIRGFGSSQASVAVIRSERGAAAVLEALGSGPYGKGVGERVVLAVRSAGGNFSAKLYSAYAGEALDRLGVPVEVFQALVVAVCATLAVSALMLGGFVLAARAREFAVLRYTGVSSRSLKAGLVAVLLAYAALGGVLAGLILCYAPLGLRLFGFVVRPAPSPMVLAAGVVLVWVFASAGVLGGEVFE